MQRGEGPPDPVYLSANRVPEPEITSGGRKVGVCGISAGKRTDRTVHTTFLLSYTPFVLV